MNPSEPPAFALPGQRPCPWWIFLAAMLGYAGSIQLGFWSARDGQSIASIWPASGVALWLALRFGPRVLFAIAIVEYVMFWIYIKHDFSWMLFAASPLSAGGNALAAYVGARCVRHSQTHWTKSLGEFSEPAAYVLAALVTATISSSMGLVSLLIRGVFSLMTAPGAWLMWWTGDVVGALYMLPMLAIAPTIGQKLRQINFQSFTKRLALLAATIGVCVLSFIPRQGNAYLFTIFPLLILATGWFGTVGVRLVAFLVAVAGIFAASRGHGPFVTANLRADLLSVQLFLIAIAIVALTLPPIHAHLNLRRRGPLTLLLAGWVLSMLLYTAVQHQQTVTTETEFASYVAIAEASIHERLSIYTDAMRSAVSFLYGSDLVNRDEWTTFAETLDLPARYPGIIGLGVIFRVPHADLPTFLASAQADSAPDFTPHAVGGAPLSKDQEHYLLTYFNPLKGNEPILGLDLTTETVRRATIYAARDSGEPHLSTPIVYQLGLGRQAGLLLVQPVYRKGAPVATVAERQASIQAFITTPLVPEQFFSDILNRRGGKLQLQLFAGESTDPSQLAFSSIPAGTHPPKFILVNTITLVGQKFTLGWSPGPNFVAVHYSPLVWLALSFALATALLVGWLLNLQIFRERAEALVDDRTAALRKNEDVLLRTAAIANVGGWELDLGTMKLFWAREMCRIHEVDPPVAPALDQVINFTPPESRPVVQAAMKAAIEHGTPWDMEIPLITATGRAIWVRAQGSATMKHGRAIELHGIVQDITARRLAETTLLESQTRLQLIFEKVPIGLNLTRIVNGQRSSLRNPEHIRITGVSEKDGLDATNYHRRTPPEDLQRQLAGYAALQRGETDHFAMEKRYLHPDGKVVWAAITWMRRAAGTSGDYFELSTVTDITERKLAEAERQQFDRKLQDTQKLESLGVLAGGIAHDFNNILTGILGNASLASRDLPVDSPLQDYLETIKKGSLRAADLCKQMLAYSGKGRFVVKQFTLNQLVEETTHLLKISISKKAVLRFNLHPALPAIEADATQIRQVIMNLVINASEAIGEKSGVISLSTGLTRVDRDYLGGTLLAPELPEGTYVYFEVADTGCGMSPETQSKIFDPFFTTKFTGRGLGLAAVLGIVRGHKGALKIYSELGRGTTFKLLFPCATGNGERLVPTQRTQNPWHGQGCVLVVDDEESIRVTAAMMLKRMGFETALAADGRDAVDAFRAEPDRFTLVLMDLTMPHLDGEQAFTEMRLIRPEARVVLMSGFNEQEAISRFTNRGLSSFLQKPFAFETLRETMHRVIDLEST